MPERKRRRDQLRAYIERVLQERMGQDYPLSKEYFKNRHQRRHQSENFQFHEVAKGDPSVAPNKHKKYDRNTDR